MKKDNRKPKQQQGKNTKIKNKLNIPEKKKGSTFLIIIAFCVPVLLYLQTINFGVTNFDDDQIISNNITFLSDFGNAPQAFLTDAFIVKSKFVSYYRPLQTLSYMVDIQLSGKNKTWMYHLSNILLLGAIASSLFLLLKRLLIQPTLALFGALIYCAHPLFVSCTAWIPARGDLMLTFFSLLSFLFFIDFLKKKKIIYLFLNWATFTIALFCKETAASLPILFIVYYFTFNSEKHFEKKYLFIILFYAISGIFWFWLRSKAIGNNPSPFDVFGIAPLLSNLRIIPECIAKFFLLIGIAPVPTFSLLKLSSGFGIIILIIILFFKTSERTKKEKIFCFSWFLILMLPPMLFKNKSVDYLDHCFFLPLIGILIFLLFIFPKKWFGKGDIKRVWLLVIIFIFLSSFTFIKSRSYSDPLTFYNYVISKNQNFAMAYYNRGVIKSKMGDNFGAIYDYNKAIVISPNDVTNATIYYNRGILRANMGDKSGAIDDYNKAIAIRPDCAEAYNNKGTAMFSLGNFKEAIVNFNKAVEINPNYQEAYGNRAVSKYYLKDLTGTLEDCEKVLKLNPYNETALKLKADVQQQLQKINH